MIMIKPADRAEQCLLLIDILPQIENVQLDVPWIANMRSWFAMLFDQPALNREICHDDDDDGSDDDGG
jgi:hypothetical protein